MHYHSKLRLYFCLDFVTSVAEIALLRFYQIPEVLLLQCLLILLLQSCVLRITSTLLPTDLFVYLRLLFVYHY